MIMPLVRVHDGEAVDLGLEQLARAAHEHAVLLERPDQLRGCRRRPR